MPCAKSGFATAVFFAAACIFGIALPSYANEATKSEQVDSAPAATIAADQATQAELGTNKQVELPLLEVLRKQGMQIYLAAPVNGADSWIAEKDGQKALLLSLPNTDHVLLGNIFDAQGNNVTNTYLKAIALDPANVPDVHKTELSSIPAGFKNLAALNTIDIGQGAHALYLFLDPLCAPCRQVYQQITAQQAAKPNQVQLHVIPVGILGKNSMNVAAGLWAQADHDHALQDMVQLAADKSKASDLDKLHNSWIAQAKNDAQQAIAKNTQFLQTRRLTAVPVLFWLDARNQPKMVKGTPNNLSTVLQNLFNDPAMP